MLVSSNGYKKFDKKRLNASCEWLLAANGGDIENNIEGLDFEIVEDMDNDECCLYQKISSTMDFWYGFKTSYRTVVHSLDNCNNIGSFRLIVSFPLIFNKGIS